MPDQPQQFSFRFNIIAEPARQAHNHPSGDPTPSQADIAMTREIVKAGESLGVTVHDHLIIGRDGHVSLKAQGLMA